MAEIKLQRDINGELKICDGEVVLFSCERKIFPRMTGKLKKRRARDYATYASGHSKLIFWNKYVSCNVPYATNHQLKSLM